MEEKEKLRQIYNEISPFCAPLLFLPTRDAQATHVLNNATMSLIDTGQKRIFVTCYHVWSSYKKKKDENKNLILALGTGDNSPTILLDDLRILDGNEKCLDLAILTFKNEDLYPTGKKKFYRPENWPLSPPDEGELVAFYGFPGEYRSPHPVQDGILSRGMLFVDCVTAVNDDYIFSVDTSGIREQKIYEVGLQWLRSFGGVSGSPVFVNRNMRFELIGFVCEAWGSKGEFLRISRADFITPDGTLDYTRIAR